MTIALLALAVVAALLLAAFCAGAETGIFQRIVTVEMVPARSNISLRCHSRINISFIIQRCNFHIRKIYVYSADRIHNLGKSIEIHLYISVNIYSKAVFNGGDHAQSSFIGIGMREEIVSSYCFNKYVDSSFKGYCFYFPGEQIQGKQRGAVTAAEISGAGKRKIRSKDKNIDNIPAVRSRLFRCLYIINTFCRFRFVKGQTGYL